MKYRNIEINYFRGIKHLEVKDLSRVNVFLGQNNCGKTSILEAVFLLSGFLHPRLILNIDLFRSLIHNEENDFRFPFYNLDYSSKLKIASEMFEKNSSRILEIIPTNSELQKLQHSKAESTTSKKRFNKESPSHNDLLVETTSEDQDDFDALEFRCEVKDFHTEKKRFSSTISFDRTSTGVEFSIQTDPKKFPTFRAIYQGVQTRNPTEIAKRLSTLIVSKKKAELIDALKIVENRVIDIANTHNNMIHVDMGLKNMIPSNLMGDGFQKILDFVANIHEVRGGVMLIDEIDNGMHYSSMKKFWKTVLESAKNTDTQLFITTHSKECLFYLKEVLEEKEMKQHQKVTKCFTISKLKDDTLKAYAYDFDSFEYAIENDIEIRGEN